jgi:hypothetical protein
MANAETYPIEGECQCGNVRYQVSKPYRFVAVCHCLDCQKLSAGAFSLSMILDADAFQISRGTLKTWERPAASGGTTQCHFCPECSNRIYHTNPKMPQIVRLKPGTLDDTSILQPDYHTWVKRKQPWVLIPESVSQFETEPHSLQEVIAAVTATRTKRAQTIVR